MKLLSKFSRIMIFGRPGSGKSTFALKLHQATGIPLYHLDKYFYMQNWVERNYQEFLNIQQAIVDQDRWIIDGNSIKSLDVRWARAQVVLYFRYPRWLCYWRVIKRFFSRRFLRSRHPHIDDRAQNCPETIRFRLLAYMYNFEDRVEPIMAQCRQKYPNVAIYEIRNYKELAAISKKLFNIKNAKNG